MQPVKPGEPVKPSEPVKVVEPAKPMLIGFSKGLSVFFLWKTCLTHKGCVPETITVQNCSLYVSTDVYNYVANSTNSEFTNDKWTIKCGSHYSDEIRLETGKIIFLSVKSFKGNRSMFKDVFKNHFSLTATDVSDLKLAFAKLTKVVEEKIRKEQVDLAGLESL